MAKSKVAIVHDWFVGGGAEKVVLEIHKLYPEAPIYTSYISDEWRKRLEPAPIITGFLQKWPFSSMRKYLPILRIWWFSRLDFSDYDLVISSSGAEAKGIKTSQNTLHVNYCHAPTHYYWSRYDEYMQQPGFGRFDPVARLGLKLLVGPLRRWDYQAAQRPDYVIANSNFIKSEIKKYYGREAYVIHPPVDVERYGGNVDEPRRGFITAGRQTPYKRIALAVEACSQLSMPLIVTGKGPDNRRLKKMAGKSVTFMQADDEKLVHLFKTSQAFIFPGLDDFGIVAVEALAAGTPVIAYGQGGALDYVTKDTGLLFNEQTAKSLARALANFKPDSFNHEKIAKFASQFSAAEFRTKFSKFIAGL
ncbi:MAG TPA: glycosyltransferase [Candidatus Saccharimonadales bacterium]|nr:glycosyltransferase [Candidatus Saccharimonadales bacterium]